MGDLWWPPNRPYVELAVEMFAMPADATRVRVILAPRDVGEMSVNHPAEIVDKSAAAVSQHLANMRMARLVASRQAASSDLPETRRWRSNASGWGGASGSDHQFALRHEAIRDNPVTGNTPLRKPPAPPKALTIEKLRAIRKTAAAWRTSDRVSGPKPDGQVCDIIEVVLGTSAGIGEALAPRRLRRRPGGQSAHGTDPRHARGAQKQGLLSDRPCRRRTSPTAP